MQVLTGTTTPTKIKIVVVDLDGKIAIEKWYDLCREHSHSNVGCWIAITGSGGRHIYYSLTPGRDSCPSGILWGNWDCSANGGRGGWKKHLEIRMLADRNLVVSPPSIHIETGNDYKFIPGFSPKENCLPAYAPEWLLEMPRLETPKPKIEAKDGPAQKVEYYGPRFDREMALILVPDKAALAESWGVVFTQNHPMASGWRGCYVPGREKPRVSHPSGSFCDSSGVLHDFATGETMSFFDIGVATGKYETWRDCMNDIVGMYIGKKKSTEAY